MSERIRRRMGEEWRADPQGVQPWRLVKPADLAKVWREYATLGTVLSVKQMSKIADRLVENVIRLQTNTILAEHATTEPMEVAEECGVSASELEAFTDWAIHTTAEERRAESMRWRISDTVHFVVERAMLLANAKSPEDQAVYANMLLDVVHQRSDLASWFVEGGSAALSAISGYRPVADRPVADRNDETHDRHPRSFENRNAI
ncbi:MAG: hypothetical protein ING19_01030 [Azospirillum sp.]|nr:hypothetical protein [Azospirillum sp.]